MRQGRRMRRPYRLARPTPSTAYLRAGLIVSVKMNHRILIGPAKACRAVAVEPRRPGLQVDLHPNRLMIRAGGIRIDMDGADPVLQPRADEAVVEPGRTILHLGRRPGVDWRCRPRPRHRRSLPDS